MSWSNDAFETLNQAGYRRGGARRAVVDLLGRQSCCLTAQEIFDGLRKARRPVGIASVYRALDALVDLRLVKRVDAGDGIARYEPAPTSGEHHHHVVCRDCGKVEAFADPQLERVIDRVSGGLGYSVDEHEVVLSGACADCA
ncbi:MAG: Fur family transcriptional regulator [Gaiellaceae bacterium]|jgi:Fur family transcriptional regulator, ferric uptake regulator